LKTPERTISPLEIGLQLSAPLLVFLDIEVTLGQSETLNEGLLKKLRYLNLLE
jgi:hypothetical protein